MEDIKEKCNNSPSKENCHNCREEPRGLCWIRVLSKVLDVSPRTHSPFEVADVVIYTLEQGIYFVIKSEEIEGFRGGGDVLLRQCSKLFSNRFSLVLYWNHHPTHPMVIEQIRQIANNMVSNPRFLMIDPIYIRQVYQYFLDNFA